MPRPWTPDQIDAAFAAQRQVDPFGHRLHTIFAAIWCALAISPTTVVEFGYAAVAFCFLIRFPRHSQTHPALRQSMLPWLVLAWLAWDGLSMFWSLDRRQGFEEWGTIRFAISLLALWPVLDRRHWLIAGLAVGFLAANVAQLSHALGRAFDIPAITFDRLPHRNSGWWQPVVGGTMLTAAVGLHLPAALTGRGRARILGLLGLCISLAGVAATGSRGAWLATGSLLLIGTAWAVRRRARRMISWGHLPFWIALLVVLGAISYHTLWPTIRSRANEGIDEVQRAYQSGDYSTFTGARILMAKWALEAFESRPVQGIGAGSFKPWVAQRLEAAGVDPRTNPVHAHAHNTLLHVAATTGSIGLLIFAPILILGLRGGFSHPPPTTPGAEIIAAYSYGPAFALLGMVLVSPFDTIHVNAQTAALFWILVTLCLPSRPTEMANGK